MRSYTKKYSINFSVLTGVICLLFAMWFGFSIKTKQENFGFLTELTPNVQNGEYVYNAAGCAGCHRTPDRADRLILSGGEVFKTKYGKFYAPNVSMSVENGIGAWSLNNFANALRKGISPENEHYYPSFPYTAYNKMSDQDLVDLWGFWQTLPAVEVQNRHHELSPPYNFRLGLGIWKKMFLKSEWVGTAVDERGRYLVEALGHCAECHSPRTSFGNLRVDYWMQGGKNPSGSGIIPNLHVTVEKWSAEEMEEYLATGFTPDFDVVGGHMAEVIESTRLLSFDDRIAIYNYLEGLRKK